jgi:hypothetical protein
MKSPRAPGRTHPARWVPTLYFAEGVPFFAVALIAGILYKRLGLRNDVITLYTSLLLLPWSLKPLWSPLLEMFKTKKFFVVFLSLRAALSLALVALCLPLPAISDTRWLCWPWSLSAPPPTTSPPTACISPAFPPKSRRRTPAGRAASTTWRGSSRRAA